MINTFSHSSEAGSGHESIRHHEKKTIVSGQLTKDNDYQGIMITVMVNYFIG